MSILSDNVTKEVIEPDAAELMPLAAEARHVVEIRATKGKARRSIVYGQAIAFLFGVALLVFVINKVGVQPIFDAMAQIGFGFFALLAIIALRHVLRTLAMSTAVPPEHRGFHFLQAFFARIGGEAITFLTFTGPLLGEATKAALLKKSVPLEFLRARDESVGAVMVAARHRPAPTDQGQRRV